MRIPEIGFTLRFDLLAFKIPLKFSCKSSYQQEKQEPSLTLIPGFQKSDPGRNP